MLELLHNRQSSLQLFFIRPARYRLPQPQVIIFLTLLVRLQQDSFLVHAESVKSLLVCIAAWACLAVFYVLCNLHSEAAAVHYHSQSPWAAHFSTWLLVKFMPNGMVFPFL